MHPKYKCNECDREFDEMPAGEFCSQCGEDSNIIPVYYCPFCDVEMDYDWCDEGAICDQCDLYLEPGEYSTIQDSIDFFKSYLVYYGKRKEGEKNEPTT